jgi:hypothetical protein
LLHAPELAIPLGVAVLQDGERVNFGPGGLLEVGCEADTLGNDLFCVFRLVM